MPEPRFIELESDLALAPRREFQMQLREELERIAMPTTTTAKTGVPAGFRTVSPYITVADPERLMAFAGEAFGAREVHRATGSAGGVNLIADIGGSKLFFAGGPLAAGREKVNDLRVWVPNCDEVYRRALAAGAVSVFDPGDRPYGERNAGARGPAGNTWWIATRFEGSPLPGDVGRVSCYLMKQGAAGLIDFVKAAFGAREIGVFRTPEGGLMHGAVWLGDSMLEFGEKDTPPSAFYLFVNNPDAVFASAVAAGAKALYPPADQPYGHRVGGVEDSWGNTWYIARDLTA